MTAPALRIVIAEDSVVLREGLVALLADRGHEICAAVADADALLAAVAQHRPDVTVVDVRMPPSFTDEGLRAAIELRREHPGTGVMVFSQYVETRYATRLLAAGAAGISALAAGRSGLSRNGLRPLLDVSRDGSGAGRDGAATDISAGGDNGGALAAPARMRSRKAWVAFSSTFSAAGSTMTPYAMRA